MPDQVVEARLRDDALTRALSVLPKDQRRCWVLRENTLNWWSPGSTSLSTTFNFCRQNRKNPADGYQ